jgi:hypothetical protein
MNVDPLWPPPPNIHSHAFRLLIQDFSQLLDYVDPVDRHRPVYSQRTFELLVRACTEVEAVLRVVTGKTGQTTMVDYRQARDVLPILPAETGLLFWKPGLTFVSPFSGWRAPDGSLPWYQDYNAAKHDTVAQLQRASFDSLVQALSALVVLHFLREGFHFFDPYVSNTQKHFRHHDGDLVETFLGGIPFSVRLPEAILKALPWWA